MDADDLFGGAMAIASETSGAEAEREFEKEAENNTVRTGRLVEHLKIESSTLQQEVEARGATISALTERLAKAKKTLERRDKQMKEMAVKLETAQAEQEASNLIALNLCLQLDKTEQQINDTGRDIKNLIADNQQHRNEISKLNKQVAISTKRYQLLVGVKADLEGDRDHLRQQITEMKGQINLGKKQTESDVREIKNLNRQKEILEKNIQEIQKLSTIKRNREEESDDNNNSAKRIKLQNTYGICNKTFTNSVLCGNIVGRGSTIKYYDIIMSGSNSSDSDDEASNSSS